MKPQSFFIDSTDGKLKVFTTPFPKSPPNEKEYSGDQWKYATARKEYEQAIELAKKEAVEVSPECRQAIEMKLCRSYTYPLRDEIMTINMEERIEVVEVPEFPGFDHTSYPTFKKVAKIIPKKAEGSEQNFKLNDATTYTVNRDGNTYKCYKNGQLIESSGVMADGTILTKDSIPKLYKDYLNALDEECRGMNQPHDNSGIHSNYSPIIGESIFAGNNDAPKAEESEDAIYLDVIAKITYNRERTIQEVIDDLKKHFEIKRKA